MIRPLIFAASLAAVTAIVPLAGGSPVEAQAVPKACKGESKDIDYGKSAYGLKCTWKYGCRCTTTLCMRNGRWATRGTPVCTQLPG